MLGNGSLQILAASMGDEGVYKCVGVHPDRVDSSSYAATLTLACRWFLDWLIILFTYLIIYSFTNAIGVGISWSKNDLPQTLSVSLFLNILRCNVTCITLMYDLQYYPNPISAASISSPNNRYNLINFFPAPPLASINRLLPKAIFLKFVNIIIFLFSSRPGQTWTTRRRPRWNPDRTSGRVTWWARAGACG